MSSRVIGTLLRDSLGQPQKQIVYGEVSLLKPAPVSFASTLYVVIPDWSTDDYWPVTPGNWFACHGSTLPQPGAHCLLIYDNQGTLTCPLWGSASTVFNASQLNGATLPLAASWTAPALGNSWANQGGAFETAGYLKDPLGFVHLKGVVTGGATNTVAFTLPAGYRPGATTMHACGAGGGTSAQATAQIAATGTVSIQWTVSGSFIGLDIPPFLAEN